MGPNPPDTDLTHENQGRDSEYRKKAGRMGPEQGAYNPIVIMTGRGKGMRRNENIPRGTLTPRRNVQGQIKKGQGKEQTNSGSD